MTNFFFIWQRQWCIDFKDSTRRSTEGSMRPNESEDKKRNTAKRSFCLFAFGSIGSIGRERWFERDRTVDSWDSRTSKNKPDCGVFLSGWIFRATSGGVRFKRLRFSSTRIEVRPTIFDGFNPHFALPTSLLTSHEGRSERTDGRFTISVDHPRTRQLFTPR